MREKENIGIDRINLYSGRLKLPFSAIAKARGYTQKDLDNVQFLERGVPPIFEDPVTLGVNAAIPLLDDEDSRDIQLLIVATESSFDWGKPISTYIHRHLKLPDNCRNFEVKHACYAGTATVQMALSWIKANPERHKKALVIMTDASRPHFTDSAELTGGAGAIALTISSNPRTFTVDPITGCATSEVFDVSRPSKTFEWGDQVLSLSSFLDLAEMAWNDYKTQQGLASPCSLEELVSYMTYHTPLVSLIQKTHQVLLEQENEDTSLKESAESFEKMTRPALLYSSLVGNIYSATLYALLVSLISEHEPAAKAGTKIGCFSYGSGSCAEFFTVETKASGAECAKKLRIFDQLKSRKEINFEQYEYLLGEYQRLSTKSDWNPHDNALSKSFLEFYEGYKYLMIDYVENYHRIYRWS